MGRWADIPARNGLRLCACVPACEDTRTHDGSHGVHLQRAFKVGYHLLVEPWRRHQSHARKAAAGLSGLMDAALGAAPTQKRYRATQKVSPFYADLLASVGPESELNQRIYLVTISRVLCSTAGGGGYRDLSTLSREDVGRMVKDAFDNPIVTGAGGRPRGADSASRVEFLAVAIPRGRGPTLPRSREAPAQDAFHACKGKSPTTPPHTEPLVIDAFAAVECRTLHPRAVSEEAARRR